MNFHKRADGEVVTQRAAPQFNRLSRDERVAALSKACPFIKPEGLKFKQVSNLHSKEDVRLTESFAF